MYVDYPSPLVDGHRSPARIRRDGYTERISRPPLPMCLLVFAMPMPGATPWPMPSCLALSTLDKFMN